MKKRLPLFVSFILFIALSASIAYWAMQFSKGGRHIRRPYGRGGGQQLPAKRGGGGA